MAPLPITREYSWPDISDKQLYLSASSIFAPTDKAFEKVPKHAPKPSKEQLKKVLLYHVSPEFFPAGRVLVTRTIPTVYSVPETLGIGPQRLSVNIGLRGLTLNFYSRIIAINIVSRRFLASVTDSS